MKKRAVISYTLVAAIIVNLVAFNVNAAAEMLIINVRWLRGYLLEALVRRLVKIKVKRHDLGVSYCLGLVINPNSISTN